MPVYAVDVGQARVIAMEGYTCDTLQHIKSSKYGSKKAKHVHFYEYVSVFMYTCPLELSLKEEIWWTSSDISKFKLTYHFERMMGRMLRRKHLIISRYQR